MLAKKSKRIHLTYWASKLIPQILNRPSPNWDHLAANYWHRNFYYFLYCILMGNGIEWMPMALRFAFDLSGGFLVLLAVISAILYVIPFMYIEIFLGKYVRLSNGQLYKMSPLFFGYCIVLMIGMGLWLPQFANNASLLIMSALQLIIDPNHIDNCPANATTCYDFKKNGPINDTCQYTFMSITCKKHGKLRYVTEYFYWHEFRKWGSDFFSLWQGIVSICITWMFIFLITMSGIKWMGYFLLLFFIANIGIHTGIFLFALTVQGGIKGVQTFFQYDMNNIKIVDVFLGLFFCSLKIGPNGHMTFSAYSFRKMGIGAECFVIVMLNIMLMTYNLIIAYAIAGVLSNNMGLKITDTMVPHMGYYCAMVPAFLRFRSVPIILIFAFYLSNWLLELVKLSLVLHMLLMNIYDFFPKISKQHKFFLPAVVAANTIVTLLLLDAISVQIVFPMYKILQVYILQSSKIAIQGLMIFVCYRVGRLSDDIQFFTGYKPIRMLRHLWVAVPIVTLVGVLYISAIDMDDSASQAISKGKLSLEQDFPNHDLVRNMKQIFQITIVVLLVFSVAVSFFYVVSSSKYNTNMLNLITPQFYWGPPDKKNRIARKQFSPQHSVRFRLLTRKGVQLKQNAIRTIRDREFIRNVYSGHIFLDAQFDLDTPKLAGNVTEVIYQKSCTSTVNNV